MDEETNDSVTVSTDSETPVKNEKKEEKK